MNPGGGHIQSQLRETVELAQDVLRLPAVATPDWADLAAASLTRLGGVHSVCVLVWLRGGAGSPPSLEAAGVWVRAGSSPRENPVLLVRSRVERERRIGALAPPGPEPGAARVGRVSPPTGGDGRGRLWQGFEIHEIVSAAISIDGANDGDTTARLIECLVAVDTDHAGAGERIAAALRAVGPMLGARAALALAPGEAGRSPWLTERETAVLGLLIQGLSVRLIAERIGRSPHTVHDHVKNLHHKLGASTRGELVARALGFPEWAAGRPASGDARRAGAQVEPKAGVSARGTAGAAGAAGARQSESV